MGRLGIEFVTHARGGLEQQPVPCRSSPTLQQLLVHKVEPSSLRIIVYVRIVITYIHHSEANSDAPDPNGPSG